jgi:hypothetical protein
VRQATALGLKLAAYLVIFGVTMPILGGMPLAQSIILAAFHTLLLWLLGDLVILPRFGNLVATAGDAGVLLFGSAFVLGAMQALPEPLGLTVAIGLGMLFEWWFHRRLQRTSVIS